MLLMFPQFNVASSACRNSSTPVRTRINKTNINSYRHKTNKSLNWAGSGLGLHKVCNACKWYILTKKRKCRDRGSHKLQDSQLPPLCHNYGHSDYSCIVLMCKPYDFFQESKGKCDCIIILVLPLVSLFGLGCSVV